jgi:Protein of unknown function (DUF3551)
MRMILAASIAAIVGSTFDTAQADPYRWCAVYGGRHGATNCYFVTLRQCEEAVSGTGGYCRRNLFYTGPDDRRWRKRRHR